MSSKLICRRDLDFLLYQVMGADGLVSFERFAEHSRETFDATLDTAESIAIDHFASHAAELDENEPRCVDQQVALIPQVKAALAQYYDAGFGAATQDYALGGMQLPLTISVACKAIFSAANVSTLAYASLSAANANVIGTFGSESLRRLYRQPLLDGRFTGTMALTEPQAGSSLGDIATTALPTDDGHYLMHGSKMFISAGDHELSENIVHLVLARIKGAPAGVKGLSLFLVPKYLVEKDGALGARNDVVLGGLIHKMGYRGTTSTILNFGERGGAVAYLVGEPHQGLAYMFQMMNEARIGVGVGAVGLGYTAYQHALDYAQERHQGRPVGNKDASSPPQPLIAHSDVRRMLLAAKSYVEGGLCLSLYGAQLADRKAWSGEAAERERARTLLDLLTPVLKSWPSRYCLEANSLAIQVHGGYGYTRDYPVERLYRDNRLNPIHEGTEGIQSLDLLGRKVMMREGEAFELLCGEIELSIQHARSYARMREFSDSLHAALDMLRDTTKTLSRVLRAGDTELALANSSLYLDAFGHLVVAWLWLRQAEVALRVEDTSNDEARAFYRGKYMACQYFFRWELPRIEHACRLLSALDTTCLEVSADNF
ncbi:acyl-CoA dehydrogenase [Halomonas eurihalina]|uniref:Acyl-CoA dehydrogenase n=1 Tax=Halomonas eurihalina TaxID=42566 RepID=A0A5D9CLR9_HALER|nr:acyl-CoA dehydrogenase [Halomonas eurihalina]MDR5861221.1 acyl-CoA dehydrogenase [Halomonas eurihalina]TZG32594.1 acyl-CoA dehydrogenase [Halomonas eurihalina]